MIFSVEISAAAKKDLYDIYSHIANVLLVPESAANLIDRLEDHIIGLQTMPERFRIYDGARWENLRFIAVDNYIIFYIVDKATSTVHVTRIMYGGRNIDQELDF